MQTINNSSINFSPNYLFRNSLLSDVNLTALRHIDFIRLNAKVILQIPLSRLNDIATHAYNGKKTHPGYTRVTIVAKNEADTDQLKLFISLYFDLLKLQLKNNEKSSPLVNTLVEIFKEFLLEKCDFYIIEDKQLSNANHYYYNKLHKLVVFQKIKPRMDFDAKLEGLADKWKDLHKHIPKKLGNSNILACNVFNALKTIKEKYPEFEAEIVKGTLKELKKSIEPFNDSNFYNTATLTNKYFTTLAVTTKTLSKLHKGVYKDQSTVFKCTDNSELIEETILFDALNHHQKTSYRLKSVVKIHTNEGKETAIAKPYVAAVFTLNDVISLLQEEINLDPIMNKLINSKDEINQLTFLTLLYNAQDLHSKNIFFHPIVKECLTAKLHTFSTYSYGIKLGEDCETLTFQELIIYYIYGAVDSDTVLKIYDDKNKKINKVPLFEILDLNEILTSMTLQLVLLDGGISLGGEKSDLMAYQLKDEMGSKENYTLLSVRPGLLQLPTAKKPLDENSLKLIKDTLQDTSFEDASYKMHLYPWIKLSDENERTRLKAYLDNFLTDASYSRSYYLQNLDLQNEYSSYQKYILNIFIEKLENNQDFWNAFPSLKDLVKVKEYEDRDSEKKKILTGLFPTLNYHQREGIKNRREACLDYLNFYEDFKAKISNIKELSYEAKCKLLEDTLKNKKYPLSTKERIMPKPKYNPPSNFLGVDEGLTHLVEERLTHLLDLLRPTLIRLTASMYPNFLDVLKINLLWEKHNQDTQKSLRYTEALENVGNYTNPIERSLNIETLYMKDYEKKLLKILTQDFQKQRKVIEKETNFFGSFKCNRLFSKAPALNYSQKSIN